MWLQSPCKFDPFSEWRHCCQSILTPEAFAFRMLPRQTGFQQQASAVAGIRCIRVISCSSGISCIHLEQSLACRVSRPLMETDGRPCGSEAPQVTHDAGAGRQAIAHTYTSCMVAKATHGLRRLLCGSADRQDEQRHVGACVAP